MIEKNKRVLVKEVIITCEVTNKMKILTIFKMELIGCTTY